MWKKAGQVYNLSVFSLYIFFVFLFITGATAEGLENPEIRQLARKITAAVTPLPPLPVLQGF